MLKAMLIMATSLTSLGQASQEPALFEQCVLHYEEGESQIFHGQFKLIRNDSRSKSYEAVAGPLRVRIHHNNGGLADVSNLRLMQQSLREDYEKQVIETEERNRREKRRFDAEKQLERQSLLDQLKKYSSNESLKELIEQRLAQLDADQFIPLPPPKPSEPGKEPPVYWMLEAGYVGHIGAASSYIPELGAGIDRTEFLGLGIDSEERLMNEWVVDQSTGFFKSTKPGRPSWMVKEGTRMTISCQPLI